MANAEPDTTAAGSPRPLLRICAALLLMGLVLSRVGAVYTESVNWDEFGLLENAAQTAASGQLHAGGRPGLAVLLVLPLVNQCGDEIAAVHGARLLWLVITGLMLLGLAKLASQMAGSLSLWERRYDALLALALLALVPTFLEWSIQVRSDQIALAAGLWGGVALLGSRARPALALAAGLLFGLGYLASQKLVYVGALAGLLALGRLWMDGDWRVARELLRALLVVAGGAAVLAAFPLFVAWLFPAQPVTGADGSLGASFSAGMGAFEFYRQTIGHAEYAALLPFLLPHVLLLALLFVATRRAWADGGAQLRRLLLAWAVLGLGLAVALFHAAAFAYFFMTLGLFPAVAFAIARLPLLELLPEAAARRRAALAGFSVLVVGPGVVASALMLQDSQTNQRESLSFIARNFAAGEQGFHPEGALFCRLVQEPFPIYFSQQIYAYFGRDPAIRVQSTRKMIEDFESRQVKFVLESWRLSQFPEDLRRFWDDHYQPYRGSVLVAGRYFDEGHADGGDFDLLVDGEYRWLPLAGNRSLSVDGHEVLPGGRVTLRRGPHRAEDPGAGYLVLALNEPPGLAEQPFYGGE